MTAVDHAELKRVAEGATPGPWTYRDMRPNTYGPAFVDASDVQSLAICGDAVGRSDTHGFCLQVDADVRMANAAFIAAANPAVVLALLSEIEGLKAERDGWIKWADEKICEAQAETLAALRTQAPDSWRPDREAVARCIIGPRFPVPSTSKFSLSELRDVRWESARSEDRADALSAADAILALRPQTAESGT